jgi:hypothetical protein
MVDEVAFSARQPGLVRKVYQKVNLFCHPERSFGFLVHPPDVGMVNGKEYKAVWIFCSSSLGARSLLFLAILCFDGCLGGLGAFLAFLVVWAVLMQNLFQLLPLFADEVGDLMESLVQDGVLEGHNLV